MQSKITCRLLSGAALLALGAPVPEMFATALFAMKQASERRRT
jgi:Ca2+/Na+ antiporter